MNDILRLILQEYISCKGSFNLGCTCKYWNDMCWEKWFEECKVLILPRKMEYYCTPSHYPANHFCGGFKINYSLVEYFDCSEQEFFIYPFLPNDLYNCKTLICYSCGLVCLPDLPNCKKLICSDNRLTELPDSLSNCEYLDCSFNPYLVELPPCLKISCKHLECCECGFDETNFCKEVIKMT